MRAFRFILPLLVLVLADGALLVALTKAADMNVLVARLVSLACGLAGSVVLNQQLPVPITLAARPGLRPLLSVVILLNYGIFDALAIRAPQIQPLAHLGASWLGSLAFLLLGLWRIGRWRDDA